MGGLATEIRTWLGNDGLVSIELPGRWFGRPMDNRHTLTWAVSGETRTFLEFDGQLGLLLVDHRALEVDGRVGSVSAAHIVFDWRGFGTNGRHTTEVFEDGILRLHRH